MIAFVENKSIHFNSELWCKKEDLLSNSLNSKINLTFRHLFSRKCTGFFWIACNLIGSGLLCKNWLISRHAIQSLRLKINFSAENSTITIQKHYSNAKLYFCKPMKFNALAMFSVRKYTLVNKKAFKLIKIHQITHHILSIHFNFGFVLVFLNVKDLYL